MTIQGLVIRPMRAADVPVVERLSAEAFLELDRATLTPGWPTPVLRSEVRAVDWCRRTSHFLSTDPRGCWVAEAEGTTLGFATSYRRDLSWFLATYAVRPRLQGHGIGRPLLEAALSHSAGCLRGMLAASADPKAARRYKLAGFDLHPEMRLTGLVERGVLPVVEHVREGSAADFELMDSIDRRIREAAHGPDHPLLSELYRLVVTDRSTGSGYAYLNAVGEPATIAATNRRTAQRLLWEALASSRPGTPFTIEKVTGANQWAVDVGVRARLAVHPGGYLAVRGMKPPAPYLHHGSFL
ncbi:MAG: GNAT family N-acetyltransferase [Actinomycetota bacterium]|nr:GNAT family N-acetyltransferase [Actinomycetota bacterium]